MLERVMHNRIFRGTALFVHPGERWFALCFSSNMASRMMARMEFRRAVAGL